MAKMNVIEDDGTTNSFSQFIAVGVTEDGRIVRMAEDEEIGAEMRVSLLMEGAKLLAEIAHAVQPDKE